MMPHRIESSRPLSSCEQKQCIAPSTWCLATVGGTLVGTTYTTNAITADCTVTASFTEKNSPMDLKGSDERARHGVGGHSPRLAVEVFSLTLRSYLAAGGTRI
jgi:hypothetical protein